MNQLNKTKGFTLIEILVVLIILGVLAAVALPNLFSNVARARGAEAVASFSSMKAGIEACGQKNQSYATCNLPTSQAGAHGNFTYYMDSTCANALANKTNNVGAAATYCIVAMGGNPGDTAADYIQFSVAALGGAAACTGVGRYVGVC